MEPYYWFMDRGMPPGTWSLFEGNNLSQMHPDVNRRLDKWLVHGQQDLALDDRYKVLFPARIGHIKDSATDSINKFDGTKQHGWSNVKLYVNVIDKRTGDLVKFVRNYDSYRSAPMLRVPPGQGRREMPRMTERMLLKYDDEPEIALPRVLEKYGTQFHWQDNNLINEWLKSATHHHDVILTITDEYTEESVIDSEDVMVLQYPAKGETTIRGVEIHPDYQRTFQIHPQGYIYGNCKIEGCMKEARFLCGQCKTAEYCGKKCQAKDWKNHKESCF